MNTNPLNLAEYEALVALNRHFHEALRELEVFKRFGLLRKTVLQEVRAAIEETRAWASFEVIDAMNLREEADWTRFGRVRRGFEQRNENLDNPRKRRARSEVHELERFSQGKIKRRGKSTK